MRRATGTRSRMAALPAGVKAPGTNMTSPRASGQRAVAALHRLYAAAMLQRKLQPHSIIWLLDEPHTSISCSSR